MRIIGESLPTGKCKNKLLNLSGIRVCQNSFIGRQTVFIDAFLSDTIIVECNVAIAPGCKLVSASDGYPSILSDNVHLRKVGKIVIKKNAWLGAGVIILPGVIVGENSVIGAGSVLTKSTGPNEMWFGNPARYHKNISFE